MRTDPIEAAKSFCIRTAQQHLPVEQAQKEIEQIEELASNPFKLAVDSLVLTLAQHARSVLERSKFHTPPTSKDKQL